MNEPIKPEDVKPDTFPKALKPNVLTGLPEWLKEPESYQKVQKALLETLASKHSHSDILEWGSCVKCQKNIHDHAEMVRKFGFTSPAQYYAWKKVHAHIERRVRLR